jgi:aspartyl protease family protein
VPEDGDGFHWPGVQVRQANSIAILMLALAAAGPSAAADVSVVGLFGNKAVVSIDGGQPRTLRVGQKTAEGVALVAVDGESATFEVDGKRRTLKMGQAYSGRATGSGNQRTVLKADGRGHFVADGQVNGATVRFLVDTGATLIALPATEAKRMGVSYLNAPRGVVSTANGSAAAYKVKLDTVRVGDITINNVDAVVIENGLAIPLLGMSFLNRTR